jgi:hypothetical protein
MCAVNMTVIYVLSPLYIFKAEFIVVLFTVKKTLAKSLMLHTLTVYQV